MAVTAFGTGAQLTVIGTEHFLPDANGIDEAGTYTLHVDTNVMAAGDVIELRVYQMITTGGTARVCYVMRYYGAQPADDLIKVSAPISNELVENNALRFSLKQTFGSVHTYPWKILKHA